MSSLATFAISNRGVALVLKLATHLSVDGYIPSKFRGVAAKGSTIFEHEQLHETLEIAFRRYNALVLIMPLGAAVRLIAPFVRDKKTDPAVVVVDEAGTQIISLLSGHLGGGNDLARQVAFVLGGRPIITTASDVLNLPALDLLGKDYGWTIEDYSDLTRATAALINGELVGAFQDAGEEAWWENAPRNIVRYSSIDDLYRANVSAYLVITDKKITLEKDLGPLIIYRPKTLFVGVGCVRGVTAVELEELIATTFSDRSLAFASIKGLATIDLKKDEIGISEVAANHNWPIQYFRAAELGKIEAIPNASEIVKHYVGTLGVCEPAALIAAKANHLLVSKVKSSRATVAVARLEIIEQGSLAIVGIGPGDFLDITQRARGALEAADVIVGYRAYLDQVRPWLGQKTYQDSSIGEETERCRLAISLAMAGQHVALVSSGDAGIYGMAGLVFETLESMGFLDKVELVNVIPGISAAQAAASLIGAPLMSDFASISLSDLMIPWDVIRRRLEAAGAGDFVVALYNPASSRRREGIIQAQQILLRYRRPSTPLALVRNASRPGQTITLTDLGHLHEHQADMLTVIIIGNTATERIGDRIVTRRGYPINSKAKDNVNL